METTVAVNRDIMCSVAAIFFTDIKIWRTTVFKAYIGSV